MGETAIALKEVLDKYASPRADIVLRIPGKGFSPDYVGHADATRTLIEIDPEWSWEPQAWSADGGPLIMERNGQLVMWGFLTLLGKRMPCVGTCEANKKEADKELIGDLIRNGAMRFGVFVNLWSKADHDEAKRPAEPPKPVWEEGAEARWKTLADRLKALPKDAKDGVIAELTGYDLFKDRRPVTPFDTRALDSIEALIDAKAVTPAADHSPHAIEVMAYALDCDPLNPPEGGAIEQWMWDLAEVEDLDAYDWTPVIRATKCRAVGILSRAQMVADRLVVAGQDVLVPDAVKEIHGAVAAELRVSVLKQEPVF